LFLFYFKRLVPYLKADFKAEVGQSDPEWKGFTQHSKEYKISNRILSEGGRLGIIFGGEPILFFIIPMGYYIL
jgi:hypothetical protein